MLYVIIYMLVLNLPTSSLGCVRLFDRTKRRVGDVVVGGVKAAVAETAPQRAGVSTAGPSPPTQARAAADRTRTTVRAHRRRRGHPLAVSPTPSPLEETPQTAPKTATTDDPSSPVFLRTLEPFHSRRDKTNQSLPDRSTTAKDNPQTCTTLSINPGHRQYVWPGVRPTGFIDCRAGAVEQHRSPYGRWRVDKSQSHILHYMLMNNYISLPNRPSTTRHIYSL